MARELVLNISNLQDPLCAPTQGYSHHGEETTMYARIPAY